MSKEREALEKILSIEDSLCMGCNDLDKAKEIATQALAPQDCDVTTQVNVTECSFYNDHDCSEPECDEILDERFLPVYLCNERMNCTFRKYNKCKFFQNGYCGEFCASDGEEYYFGNGLQKCSDNPNCYYKQLHSQQKTFTLEEVKKLINKITQNHKCLFVEDFVSYFLAEVEDSLEFEKEGK